jgi:hypothetical protein
MELVMDGTVPPNIQSAATLISFFQEISQQRKQM